MQTELGRNADRSKAALHFPDKNVILLRHRRQVTRVSLFAIISQLCPNTQVASGGLAGGTGRGGLDEQEAADPAAPTAGTADITDTPGIAMVARHMPPDATEAEVTKTRLTLLDELQADVAKIYDGGEASGSGFRVRLAGPPPRSGFPVRLHAGTPSRCPVGVAGITGSIQSGHVQLYEDMREGSSGHFRGSFFPGGRKASWAHAKFPRSFSLTHQIPSGGITTAGVATILTLE